MDKISADYDRIEGKLGYCFKDKKLLMLSFVHRSFFHENPSLVQEHNERLEFLGDAILGAIVSEFLYKTRPDDTEGYLSHVRAQVVGSETCHIFLKELQLEEYILLGKGESIQLERGRSTILADLFEALIGAIYLDSSFEAVKKFFLTHFRNAVEEIAANPDSNWKADLQHHCQTFYRALPVYQVVQEDGPEHRKMFMVVVSIDEMVLGKGEGRSKKKAEQLAAKEGLQKIKRERARGN